VNESRDRIVRAAGRVTNEMLTSTRPESEYHLDVCRATNDAIFRSAERIRNCVRSSV